MTTGTGSMSNAAWEITSTVIEKITDIIKSALVILGILAANIADVAFGTIAIGILFSGSTAATVYGFWWLDNWVFGGLISVASSAFQIILWSVIQRRGLTFGQIIRLKIPRDIVGLIVVTGIMWLIDTLIDMAPLALMVQNSPFQTINWLYVTLVVFVGILVFMLCGFAEIATSNLRGAIGSSVPVSSRASNPQTMRTPATTHQYRPVEDRETTPTANREAPRGQRTSSGQSFHKLGGNK